MMFALMSGGAAVAALMVGWIIISIMFRRVVSTNDVHIVQSAKKTVSYGKDQSTGNTYYAWPAFLPVIGVRTISLPVSVFDVSLDAYAAYDKGRVPFSVDIMAFFRITDSNMAAQRVHSLPELLEQLKSILQGAVRSILASSEIEEILEGRGKFGHMFTEEVEEQLKAWGVSTVKSIELMDIRDAEGSTVIANIMAKKKSMIEMQSRVEVAGNIKTAQMAEIDAKREVLTREQEAAQQVGIRTAQKVQEVGIADQQSKQAIKEQEKLTAEKEMAVSKVNEVRKAEIQRDVLVVKADQEKQTAVIKAEGEKQQTVLVAQGQLEKAQFDAKGIEATGKARGEAEKAVLLAPVTAQLTLAKEIGSNQSYQQYLVSIRQIEASQAIGMEQAGALKEANIKIIANSDKPSNGLTSVMDIFTTGGGTKVAAAIEAFSQTETGAAIVEAVTGKKGE